MLNTAERLVDKIEYQNKLRDALGIDLRVAAPGIIQSVDYEKQTCTVQLSIRERLNNNGDLTWTEVPILLDVPLFVYSGGGYYLTLPVQSGDECLVVFGDNCMDAWWQSGGVQNQVERRRHDLSDGFAIVGFHSLPHTVPRFSSSSAQLRNSSGSAVIEIAGSTINIKASSININGQTIVNGETEINGKTSIIGATDISGGTTIDGKVFLDHTHDGVQSGGGNTGGVN